MLPVHNRILSGKFTLRTDNFSPTFISFNANGTYQKSGFSSASLSVGRTTRGLGSGQYRFEGYTLTLTPSNGPPELYTAFFENQDPDPTAIFIDNSVFLKDGR